MAEHRKTIPTLQETFAVDNIADFGRSVPYRDINKPEKFADWLNELFDVLGLGNNINIAGLSYGGWVTCLYALKYQERLNKIVLLAPAATVLPLCKQFWVRVIFSALLPHRYFTKSLVYWLCEDMHKKDDASRKILGDAIDDLYLGIRSFKPRKMPIPTILKDSELQHIRIPALYLVGQNEKIYSADNAVQRLNNVAPEIITEIVPDAGHDLIFVKPDTISKRILAFLKEKNS